MRAALDDVRGLDTGGEMRGEKEKRKARASYLRAARCAATTANRIIAARLSPLPGSKTLKRVLPFEGGAPVNEFQNGSVFGRKTL